VAHLTFLDDTTVQAKIHHKDFIRTTHPTVLRYWMGVYESWQANGVHVSGDDDVEELRRLWRLSRFSDGAKKRSWQVLFDGFRAF
jgi:hypothetical protein